jgi:hypothetical protein
MTKLVLDVIVTGIRLPGVAPLDRPPAGQRLRLAIAEGRRLPAPRRRWQPRPGGRCNPSAATAASASPFHNQDGQRTFAAGSRARATSQSTTGCQGRRRSGYQDRVPEAPYPHPSRWSDLGTPEQALRPTHPERRRPPAGPPTRPTAGALGPAADQPPAETDTPTTDPPPTQGQKAAWCDAGFLFVPRAASRPAAGTPVAAATGFGRSPAGEP